MFWKSKNNETNQESQKKTEHLIELVNVKKQYGIDDPENWIEAVHALRWINFFK